MPITKYKLEKLPQGGMGIPNYIVAGGYWSDPGDDTMLGWFRTSAEYALPEVNPLTKSQVADRFLDVHSRIAFMAEDEVTPLTNTEVIALSDGWVDMMYSEQIVEGNLAEIKDYTTKQAFRVMEEKLEDAFVEVFIASANTNCPFGCDKTTQDNIIGINTAIAVGVPVANPTYWTPKGYAAPVEVTHSELIAVGGAILNKKNEYYQNYFIHKGAISTANTYTSVATYDYATGYN